MLREGTIVDASIIAAPTSTKNEKGERDPAMTQTKKGNEWHFGMKMHIGTDSELGIVHSLTITAASVHDVTQTAAVMQGDETGFWGDAGYQGIEKRREHADRQVEWHIAMRPGKRRRLDQDDRRRVEEKAKASIRAKVEHPFRYVKQMFDYTKFGYRGLKKNTGRIYLLLVFTNLLISERYT